MRVVLKHPAELLDSETAAWRRMWAADGALASPFRSLDFTLAAAPVRADSAVMVGRGEDGAIDLVLPVQISAMKLARPLGAPMCDVNGPLLSARVRGADVAAALRQAGVAAYAFSGWPQPEGSGVRGAAREGCAVADLSGGFEAWLEAQRDAHPRHFKKMRRLSRQAERDFGPIETRLGAARPGELETLIGWKRAQFARTGRHDILRPSWTRALLARCARAHQTSRQGDDFSGVMASLYLGGRLAAAEFGLRSRGVLHGWIAGYDPAFASVSPGLILQERLLEEAAKSGVRHAVLGVGESHYKQYYTSWMAPLDSGLLPAAGLAGTARALAGEAWRRMETRSELALRARRRLDVILAVETRARDQVSGVMRAGRGGRAGQADPQAGAAGHLETMVAASK